MLSLPEYLGGLLRIDGAGKYFMIKYFIFIAAGMLVIIIPGWYRQKLDKERSRVLDCDDQHKAINILADFIFNTAHLIFSLLILVLLSITLLIIRSF